MNTPFERATDPHQYDRDDTGWQESFKGLDSPTRAHFWEFIKPIGSAWQGKRLLDIGTGTAWLPAEAIKVGAAEVVGIDPSEKNVEVATKLYPHVEVIKTTLEDYESDSVFDVITAVFCLSHVADIDKGFEKIAQLMSPGGELLAIVPDPAYNRRARNDYEIVYQELTEDEYVSQVRRSHGTIADIIRTMKRYELAAKNSGLRLDADIPMKPTEALMQKEPKYIAVKDLAMTHLLRFIRE